MITIDEPFSLVEKKREVLLRPKDKLSQNTPYLVDYPYRNRQDSQKFLENLFNSQLAVSYSERKNQNSKFISHLLVHFAKHLQLLESELLSHIPYLDIAKQSLEIARELSPNLVEPYLELGYFEYAICDRSLKALKYFNIAEEKAQQNSISKDDKTFKQILIGKIKCYLDLDKCDRAREEVEKAQKLFPDDSDLEILEYELEEYEEDL